MHDLPFGQGQGQLLWLFSGTGEGPPLATAWLNQGWRLCVFVVGPSAGRAYPPRQDLQLRVGPVGDRADLQQLLVEARSEGRAPLWIIDATHPFATRISTDLATVSQALEQPLLRLLRPLPSLSSRQATQLVPDWQAVASRVPPGARVLLAIGARQLGQARAALPGRLLHARVLPTAESLALALASGLSSDQLAALHPGSADQEVLKALCRRWRIGTVVARASGGSTEEGWRRLCQALGLQLVLLERPVLPLPGLELLLPEALERLSPGAAGPGR